jgi:cell division protein FtsQ
VSRSAVPLGRIARKPQPKRRTRRAIPAPPVTRPHRRSLARRLLAGWFLGRLVALGLILLGGWTVSYGAEAPQFVVKRVTVSGNDLVPTEEILSHADVQGTNIFQARRGRLVGMLRTVPGVRDADVQIRFPDQIHIVVRERTPVAVWDTGGLRMLVDSDGYALREGDGNLPVIVVHDAPRPAPGDRVDSEAVQIAEEVAPRLRGLGLGDAQLDYRPATGVTLVTSGRRVAIGFADHLDAKLDAYRTIRDHLDQSHTPAELVDVRFLDRPYFR